MDARTVLRTLMERIDERRWDELEPLLHQDLRVTLVHTGEVYDRVGGIRLNAEYPGFDRLRIEELTGDEKTAACRSHVTGRDGDALLQFGCASFATVEGGRIRELTEVWTDIGQVPPPGTRPES
ncbi:nuclear transport factor 2 family protein [Microbacterium gorillae]|uniref:nuclear transport factor 2 family protein n=1 Tax=Microbacterium gorillae TaxID=1231063 RepID=UPI000A46F396|nr:nuclear transport factor 2 family protein [Microbacterium gorillae]